MRTRHRSTTINCTIRQLIGTIKKQQLIFTRVWPCFERFDRQSAEYKESVLPSSCTKRVAIEAGVSGLWYKYVGLHGKAIGTDKFGFSAPGDTVMKEFGITVDNLVSVAKSL